MRRGEEVTDVGVTSTFLAGLVPVADKAQEKELRERRKEEASAVIARLGGGFIRRFADHLEAGNVHG